MLAKAVLPSPLSMLSRTLFSSLEQLLEGEAWCLLPPLSPKTSQNVLRRHLPRRKVSASSVSPSHTPS